MARTVDVVPERWMPRGEVLVVERGQRPLVVWGGIPGERAAVRIHARGAHQARGDWVSSNPADPHRVTPSCDKYTPCGGCPLMHVDEIGQRGARRSLVAEALSAVGLSEVEVKRIVPCPDGSEGFRHVVKVGFGVSEAGRLKVGAWGRNSRDIVPIPQCVVAAPVLRKAMVSLAHHTITMGIQPYEPSTGRGVLRAAVLRATRAQPGHPSEILITLVAGRRDQDLQQLAQEVAQGVPEAVGVWVHLNDQTGNAIFDPDADGVVGVSALGGREWIEERLNGIVYRIGPGDFFQTNPSTAEVLYARVIEGLELEKGESVLDLYCGVGGLTLPAAKRTGFALGVEEVDGAVNRARESARINRVAAEFVSGPVLSVLPTLGPRFEGVGPKVIVDPARRGLEDGVIGAIDALKPSRLAYVSCNARTMARDLRAFVDLGYRLSEVEPFDMFPHTPHVECVAFLTSPHQGAPTRRGPKRGIAR